MADDRFYITHPPILLSQIAFYINCDIYINGTYIAYDDFANSNYDVYIHNVKSLSDASALDISFLESEKNINNFYATKAIACITNHRIVLDKTNIILLKTHENVHFAYCNVMNLFYSTKKQYNAKYEHSSFISKSAIIGNNCYIGHNVVIEDNVILGDNVIIEHGSIIGYGSIIGNNTIIHTNVSINYTILGNNVIIHSGAKIGNDGFGFTINNNTYCTIFHSGAVIIGNDVSIGTNTTIDRGSICNTIIEDNCRIDNLVQIAHNVIIGKGTIICAQSGIAGSSKIGSYSTLAGQVGVSNGITIGKNVKIGAQSGVINNIDDGHVVAGTPAVAIHTWRKQNFVLNNLLNKKHYFNNTDK